MAEILIRVIPRARKTEPAGVRGEAFVIRIAAPPVDGSANDALVEFLADTLHVPRRAVTIISGGRGRLKRVRIAGVTDDQAHAALTPERPG